MRYLCETEGILCDRLLTKFQRFAMSHICVGRGQHCCFRQDARNAVRNQEQVAEYRMGIIAIGRFRDYTDAS